MRTAFTLLTSLPLGASSDESLTPDVAAFFPWVGWLLGSAAFLLVATLRWASLEWGSGALVEGAPYLLGTMLVLLLAVATRFLHWDGLADTADAMWNPGDASRKLEIMADSATGAFGATAIALAVLTQAAAYATILTTPESLGLIILVAPVFSRTSATFASWLGKPARPGGLGSAVIGRPGVSAALLCAASLAAAGYVMWVTHSVWGVVWCLAALVLAAVVPHLLAERIGGVTGDVMGASIIITQTLILVLAAVGSVA